MTLHRTWRQRIIAWIYSKMLPCIGWDFDDDISDEYEE